MNNYHYFSYITGDSKVHNMNSKNKILWFLLMLLSILFVRDYLSLIMILLFIFFVSYNTKISLDQYFSNINILWIVYISGFLITFLITFNIETSIFVSIKLILLVYLFTILTFTTSLSEISWGFECLFIKLKKIKIPVSRISLWIAFNIKFISSVFERTQAIRKSMAYRGVPYKSGILNTFKKMFIPAIRISIRLSKQTIDAMKLRFYGYSNKRTNYHENKTTKFDKGLIFSCFIIIYMLIYYGWIK